MDSPYGQPLTDYQFDRNKSTSIDCCACLLCWFIVLILYILIQICRSKDICCYNATHTCPYFLNVVGAYQAC